MIGKSLKKIIEQLLLMFYMLKQNPTYISKHNSNRENQVILLMISQGEGWYYLAVKRLSAILSGITSKHHGDFYCLNCLHSFATENKRKSRKKVCENKIFCNVIMPSKDTKILEFNQYKKSNKAPFVIYADLECLIEKIDGCKNNLENSFTTKVGKHIPSGFSVSTICSFKGIENKLDVCRGEDCLKKFWECLIDHTMKVINFKKGKMKLSTKEQ